MKYFITLLFTIIALQLFSQRISLRDESWLVEHITHISSTESISDSTGTMYYTVVVHEEVPLVIDMGDWDTTVYDIAIDTLRFISAIEIKEINEQVLSVFERFGQARALLYERDSIVKTLSILNPLISVGDDIDYFDWTQRKFDQDVVGYWSLRTQEQIKYFYISSDESLIEIEDPRKGKVSVRPIRNGLTGTIQYFGKNEIRLMITALELNVILGANNDRLYRTNIGTNIKMQRFNDKIQQKKLLPR